ncbi:MAG: hypothetical protein LBL55_07335 [Propionibacteriaceae bacterium]|nr:hypothetical protein [Propionibacteriaceae bacterium]
MALISALALALGGLTQPQAWAEDPPDPGATPTVPAGIAPNLDTKAKPFEDEAAGIVLAETTPVGTLWTVEYPGGNSLTVAADGETEDSFQLIFKIADGYLADQWQGFGDEAGADPQASGGIASDGAGGGLAEYTIPAEATDGLWFRATYFAFSVADESIQPVGAAPGQITATESTAYTNRLKLTAPTPAAGAQFVQFEQSADGQTWSPLPCLTASGTNACPLALQVDYSFILDNVPLASDLVFRALYHVPVVDDRGVFPEEASTGTLLVQSSPSNPKQLILTAPAPESGWFFGGFERQNAPESEDVPGTWVALSGGSAQADGTLTLATAPAATAIYRARYYRVSARVVPTGVVAVAQGASAAQVVLTLTLPEGRAVGKIEYVRKDTNAVTTLPRTSGFAAVADQPGTYRFTVTAPKADLEFTATLIEFGLDPELTVMPTVGSPVVALNPANPYQWVVSGTADLTQDYIFAGWYCTVKNAAGWTACASSATNALGRTLDATLSLSQAADQGKDVRFQPRFVAYSAAGPQEGGTYTVQRVSTNMSVALTVTSTVDDDSGTYALTRWERSEDGGGTWTASSLTPSVNSSFAATADSVFRPVFTKLDDPAQLTLFQDEDKGRISVRRSVTAAGVNQAVLAVDSTVSNADEAYAFVRWQYIDASQPEWFDVAGSGGGAISWTHSYSGDTSYRATFIRVGVEVAEDSADQGQVGATAVPDNPKQVTIQATPAAGSKFDHWEISTDDGGSWARATATQTVPPFGSQAGWPLPAEYTHTVAPTFTVASPDQSILYRAHFRDESAPDRLTVEQVEGGEVELTQLNSGAFGLQATADSGYVHVGWQFKPVDELVWQQATWANNATATNGYAILVKLADDQPVVYRARFAKADGVEVTFKTAPEAKGGMQVSASYPIQITSSTATATATTTVYATTPSNLWTTGDGAQPPITNRFLHGNLADQTAVLPEGLVFNVRARTYTPDSATVAAHFDAANYALLGFRVNGELVGLDGFDDARGSNSHVIGSLAGGQLDYLLAQSATGEWSISITNSDLASYGLAASATSISATPSGTPATAFAGDLVIEPAYVHKQAVSLDGAEVKVVRAIDGVSVSGGPFTVGGGAGTACDDANANYLSGHASPMITIQSHYYRPDTSQLTGCVAGPDTVSAFDNVVLWFPISQILPVSGPVEVEVYGGPGLDQLLGSVGWTDLTASTGVVLVPVDSLPPGDKVKVSLTVADQSAVERTYDLSNPPTTDKGLVQERADAVAQLRQVYLDGLVRNAEGTSETGQYYSSRYLMLNEEYPQAVTAIAEAEDQAALAEAVAYWTQVLEDAGNNVFSTGVTLNAGGSIVTVPTSANILMAMTAAAEQTTPGQWRLSTGYGGGWINGWQSDGWGQVTDDGQGSGGMYTVYDQACVEDSIAPGGLGVFGDACPYTNGVMAQKVYLTPEPSDGLFSTFGLSDGVVDSSWADPDPEAAWPGTIYAWPGTMGWALGELRQAFDDAELQTHEAYNYAIAHQSPLADEYELAFTDLRVEFLDFLFRKDADMTEAAKTVVRAIAGLGTQSTQADREAILSAYDLLTAPEKQAVFNYTELASWPPRGTGFIEATVTVTGPAAGLVSGATGFPVRFSHEAFDAEPARSGVLLPKADGTADRTGLLPVGAEVSLSLGELPQVPGVVWGQPSWSVESVTVADRQVHSLTVTLTADRLTLPEADPEALLLAATWLGQQLAAHDGVLPRDEGMPQDWGLTEDAVLALAAAGVGGDQIEASVARLLASGEAYVGAAGSGSWNAKGKTILVLQVTGHDPTAWPVAGGGTRDLVAELRSAVQPSGQFGAQGSGVFVYQQALSLLALARTSDGAPGASVEYVQGLQCRTAGVFLGAYGSDTPCVYPDVDGTALAVQALLAAGVSAADPSVADAVAWIESQQDASGAMAGNTNSTGLAVQALRAAGLSEESDLAEAAGFTASLQVTCAVAADPSNEFTLAEVGAVAYNAAGWADGAEFGLDEINSDQWRRASAQALFAFGGASLGTLSAAGAEAGLPVSTCQDPTPTPTPTPTVDPSETPTPTPTPTVDPSETPTPTPTADPSETPTPTPTPTVDPSDTPTPTPTADPSQVTVSGGKGASIVAGVRLTFSAFGFQPGESVRASLGSTELGVWLADDAGVVSFDWIVPEGTAVGQHSIVLAGLVSGHRASAVFSVSDQLAQTGAAPGLLVLLFLVSACFIVGGGSLALTSARGRRGA